MRRSYSTTRFVSVHFKWSQKVISLILSQTLKRVSSYPAATAEGGVPHKDPAQVVRPRRHEQTQSQHDSVETSTEFTISIDPSNTSVNSREPLISSSCVSTMGTIGWEDDGDNKEEVFSNIYLGLAL